MTAATTRTKPGEALAWLFAAIRNCGDDCILWPFARDPHGYARGWNPHTRRVDMVYRVAWELHHGASWPNGLVTRHSCHSGSEGCINPLHVTPGTQAQNIHDMYAAGRQSTSRATGSGHSNAKLTEARVADALQRISSGESQAPIAREMGVNPTTLNKVWRGKTWRHVDGPRADMNDRRS